MQICFHLTRSVSVCIFKIRISTECSVQIARVAEAFCSPLYLKFTRQTLTIYKIVVVRFIFWKNNVFNVELCARTPAALLTTICSAPKKS